MDPSGRGLDLVQLRSEREDVEQSVEERVADFLNDVGRARIAHEGRSGVAADDRARKRCGDIHRLRAGFGEIKTFVVTAEHHERSLRPNSLADRLVVRLLAWPARDREHAGQAHLLFEEMPDAARVGLIGDDGECRRAEEILRHRAPEIPNRFDRGVLLTLNERLRIDAEKFAKLRRNFVVL